MKRFARSDGHVWLMSHNPAYVPIPGDDATILGKVVAVLRRVCPPPSPVESPARRGPAGRGGGAADREAGITGRGRGRGQRVA